MNPILAVNIFLALSVGVVHGGHLFNCDNPPPPPSPCPNPSPSPEPCPSPSPPPCPSPSPPPSPTPSPSPSPPPEPCPSPSPEPSPCPSPSPSPCPNPYPMPDFSGDMYASESFQTRSSSASSAFSEKSSSYKSSSRSTTCSAIDVDSYMDAFTLASISNTEVDLYLKYLDLLSDNQITYFNDLISLYSTKSFALTDSVSDFVAFQNEMSNIYNTLSTASIYADGSCDWATQTQIYQQIQVNLANALEYTTQGSCLHNLLNFANTNLTYIPLVAGTCYHLADLQNQYFINTSYSSSSYQESQKTASSYQASSSSSSNKVTIN